MDLVGFAWYPIRDSVACILDTYRGQLTGLRRQSPNTCSTLPVTTRKARHQPRERCSPVSKMVMMMTIIIFISTQVTIYMFMLHADHATKC